MQRSSSHFINYLNVDLRTSVNEMSVELEICIIFIKGIETVDKEWINDTYLFKY